jgi:hypothetical protein
MNNQSDSFLITFKAISNFTNDLAQLFATKQRSLKLYSRLISKTTLCHDQAILKHIDAFKSFCVSNREAIKSHNIKSLVDNKISYSTRVFIDMKQIFQLADSESKSVIWKHLLYISALVDPAGKAKDILKENMSKTNTNNNKETEFLSNIIDKVEKHVKPDGNPMDAVSSIMQSGIFTDLISGMNNGLSDGNLDLSKLMGAVQGMVGSLSGQMGENNGNEPNPMSMLTSMMGSLGNMSNMSSKSPTSTESTNTTEQQNIPHPTPCCHTNGTTGLEHSAPDKPESNTVPNVNVDDSNLQIISES